jgi:hypothetical protein
MHYYDHDALFPQIRYAWNWQSRRWCAVAAGLVIVAEAASAGAVVTRAHRWAEEFL